MDLMTDLEQNKRLVVLIPGILASNTGLAHKIHWMAERQRLAVLYLVMVDGDDHDLAVSRQMTTLKAVTSANRLRVDVKQIETGNWLKALQGFICPDDLIVCLEEQKAYDRSFKTIPIKEILTSHLNLPVVPISGFYDSHQAYERPWFQELFILLGYLAIIAIFTGLEIKIDQALDGSSLATILVSLAVLVEFGAVWAWYRLDNL